VPEIRAKFEGAKRIFSMQYQLLSCWLGRQDSNLGMAESKSAALPLGYAPSVAPDDGAGA
jgi:hypothetical protein